VHIMCSNHLPLSVDHNFLSRLLQHVCLAASCGVQGHIFCRVTAPLRRKVTWTTSTFLASISTFTCQHCATPC
jgi:hypothetical protein